MYHFDDEEGDESLLFGATAIWSEIFALPPPDCSAPVVDIRALDVASNGTTATLTLSIATLGDLEARCSYLRVDGTRASYRVNLYTPYPELTTLFAPIELRANARTTGFGLDTCVEILYEDSGPSDCIGHFALEGDTLAWTFPLAGDVTVEVYEDAMGILTHPETRPYDLRGIGLDLGASATLQLEGVIGLASVRDSVNGGIVEL